MKSASWYGQSGFAKTWRADEQYVVKCLAALTCGFDKNREIGPCLLLTGKVRKSFRPDFSIKILAAYGAVAKRAAALSLMPPASAVLSIEYKVSLLDKNGDLVADWPVTGYGKSSTEFLKSRDKGMQAAINSAFRDAGARFALSFSRIPPVRQWLAANPAVCESGTTDIC